MKLFNFKNNIKYSFGIGKAYITAYIPYLMIYYALPNPPIELSFNNAFTNMDICIMICHII